MSIAVKLFAYFFISSFGLAAFGYALLKELLPGGFVFGSLPRMFLYHYSHPYQYIAVVALIYACVATPCVLIFSRVSRGCKTGVIIGIMFLTIMIASVPGGVLWEIHDMQAGYFPKGNVFLDHLFDGAMMGLQGGWLVIALSVPYNLAGLILGYFVTSIGFKMIKTKA